TIDAMGCQRDIAKKITDKKADYILAVKGNQPKLHEAFEKHFPMSKILAGDFDSVYKTEEKNRGRQELRVHVVSDIFDEFVNFSFDWAGMRTLGAVIAFRQVGDTPQKIEDVSIRYYISSAELTAKKLATSVRSHWAIENSLHYVLDVAMDEDDCQIRRGDAAEILSGFRHIALNLLKNEKTFDGGIERKMKCAMMSTDYLEQILDGSPLQTPKSEKA
ncbi:ISAs1 family transposase, partial [Sansalvadorimonas verongulae]|uniref:ISAs1 family transposase n=1 Tax=Sansalvadorimonas verongulae TaxID=2172824 RepID=UPI0012BD8184